MSHTCKRLSLSLGKINENRNSLINRVDINVFEVGEKTNSFADLNSTNVLINKDRTMSATMSVSSTVNYLVFRIIPVRNADTSSDYLDAHTLLRS